MPAAGCKKNVHATGGEAFVSSGVGLAHVAGDPFEHRGVLGLPVQQLAGALAARISCLLDVIAARVRL